MYKTRTYNLLLLSIWAEFSNTRPNFFGLKFSENFNSSHLIDPPFQQGLDPAGDALTVAVEECQNVTHSKGGANEACPYQTFPFVGADESHTLQITDVVL